MELSDRDLLRAVLDERSDWAFEEIVQRHGGMVWNVCRRDSRDEHLAEDALQATFLLLIRKATSLRSRESIAGWLSWAAYRTALKARVTASRRSFRERQVEVLPDKAAAQNGYGTTCKVCSMMS